MGCTTSVSSDAEPAVQKNRDEGDIIITTDGKKKRKVRRSTSRKYNQIASPEHNAKEMIDGMIMTANKMNDQIDGMIMTANRMNDQIDGMIMTANRTNYQISVLKNGKTLPSECAVEVINQRSDLMIERKSSSSSEYSSSLFSNTTDL